MARIKRSAAVIRFGQRVRELRRAAGLSQTELGQRARLSYKFIGEIERGITCPNLVFVFDIARALNVHVTALFGAYGEVDPSFVIVPMENVRRAAEAINVLRTVIPVRRR